MPPPICRNIHILAGFCLHQHLAPEMRYWCKVVKRFRLFPLVRVWPSNLGVPTMNLILLIVLILLLLGALPTWPHSRNWGYYPSGGLGLIVLVVVLLVLTHQL